MGFISGISAVYMFHRKIQVENILQERTKWRERVRELVSQIASKPNKKDIAELEIRLNPLDENDRKIIENAKSLLNTKEKKEIFLEQVARLLKHDWERAKNETNLFGYLYTINGKIIRALNMENRQSSTGYTPDFKSKNWRNIIVSLFILCLIILPMMLTMWISIYEKYFGCINKG